MSTVAPSTSSIERSSSFLAKQTLAKNQTASPIANAFAALLLSAEEGEPTISPDTTGRVPDDESIGQPPDASKSLADPGQAALAGLLNWQALAATSASTPAASATAQPGTVLGTSALSSQVLTPSAPTIPTLGTSDTPAMPSRLAAAMVKPDAANVSIPSSVAGGHLRTNDPAATALQPVPTSLTAATSLQPAPATLTASAFLQPATASVTPATSLQPTQASLTPATSLQPAPATLPAATSLQPAPASLTATTPAAASGPQVRSLELTANALTAPIPALPPITPIQEPNANRTGTGTDPTQVALTTPRAFAEALTSGAETSNAGKHRAGIARGLLAANSSSTKTSAGNGLPTNVTAAQTSESAVLARATVDLVPRSGSNAASDTPSSDAPTTEETLLKPENSRLATSNGASGAEPMPIGDQSAAPTLAETAPMTTLPPGSMAEVMDELSGQIAYWASQGTQRASLTVGNGTDNPLEVNISIRDGEVHVAFEAAEDEIRQALTTSAEDLLKTMLENKGMTLGDVTFGQHPPSAGQGAFAQHQRSENDQASGSGAGKTTRAQRQSASESASAAALVARRPDIATAEKVDLFA